MSPLRPADARDLDLLVDLMQEFYAESGYPLERARARWCFERLIADPALGRLWLILADGAPAGYVAVTFGFSLEYGGRDAFVDDLFLRPVARQRGLGNAVLVEVEEVCRGLEVRALHLEVERANGPAQSLYRKRGFAEDGRLLLTKRLAAGATGRGPA